MTTKNRSLAAWIGSGIASSLALAFAIQSATVPGGEPGSTFTRLVPIPGVRVVDASEPYPGTSYLATNLLDGNLRTEYSSNAKGTNTFVTMSFPAGTTIAGFQHVDRSDPATVGGSELVFKDAEDRIVARHAVEHANKRAGTTMFALPQPVSATKVTWRITRVGPHRHSTVGGAEIVFYARHSVESSPSLVGVEMQSFQMLARKEGGARQPVRVTVDSPYLEPFTATVHVPGATPIQQQLRFGAQQLNIDLEPVKKPTRMKIKVDVRGRTVATREITRQPVKPLVVHLLPHSHVDIGYTALQPDVERKQNDNLATAFKLIAATRNYPEGARFKWNVEVLWPVDNYLRNASPEARAEFMKMVKAGEIGLDALYGNILTGLCRPEELLRSFTYATQLAREAGVTVDSAMISDVPGYTWSTVSAMAHAGVRYFSFAPNYFDRMGRTMVEWQDRPFWWVGPDGKSRVLCWCPTSGYALGHIIGDGEALARYMPDYLLNLENKNYPYDFASLRWNVHGDNGSPDEKVADVVRDWNTRYESPRLVISTTSATFREFERRYGKQLPEFSGDYTPFWEDGAASSARETAMNRASADRLTQAESLWALRAPGKFPAAEFQEAWKNVLLYTEHTWGAHNSISQPDIPFVTEQWRIKQAFALDADRQSRQLLDAALALDGKSVSGAFDVINATGVEQSGLVILPAGTGSEQASPVALFDGESAPMPAQRLQSGEIAVLTPKIPAFSRKRVRIGSGPAQTSATVAAQGAELRHPAFTVRIDEQTGGIASLRTAEGLELVDAAALTKINDYFYLPGSDLKGLQRAPKPVVRVQEAGPLRASLVIESEAPGARKLVREVRAVAGVPWLELVNTIDKLPIRSKEGLHFGFGFNVPKGVVRMDVGWAAVRPEVDQIPAACKNWFSVQRWLDISNDRYGVTLAPLDAPLFQVGGITANLVGSQTNPKAWIETLSPSQTVYSWVMNNHWHTNYRAEQEGPTVFRFAILPHKGGFAAGEAARFGLTYANPLMVLPAKGDSAPVPPFKLETRGNIVVTAFKPSDDRKAWILRLFCAGDKNGSAKLQWQDPAPRKVWLSDLSEQPLKPASGSIRVPAWCIVTVRAELPGN